MSELEHPPEEYPDGAEFRCLVCGEPLDYRHGVLNDAGYCLISFHYGSTLDQGHGVNPGLDGPHEGDNDLDALLSCPEIEAYIHDDCFKRRRHLCRGMRTVRPRAYRVTAYDPSQRNP